MTYEQMNIFKYKCVYCESTIVNQHNENCPMNIKNLKTVETVQSGWTCPRCHRVWGPMVTYCYNCNDGYLKVTVSNG